MISGLSHEATLVGRRRGQSPPFAEPTLMDLYQNPTATNDSRDHSKRTRLRALDTLVCSRKVRYYRALFSQRGRPGRSPKDPRNYLPSFRGIWGRFLSSIRFSLLPVPPARSRAGRKSFPCWNPRKGWPAVMESLFFCGWFMIFRQTKFPAGRTKKAAEFAPVLNYGLPIVDKERTWKILGDVGVERGCWADFGEKATKKHIGWQTPARSFVFFLSRSPGLLGKPVVTSVHHWRRKAPRTKLQDKSRQVNNTSRQDELRQSSWIGDAALTSPLGVSRVGAAVPGGTNRLEFVIRWAAFPARASKGRRALTPHPGGPFERCTRLCGFCDRNLPTRGRFSPHSWGPAAYS